MVSFETPEYTANCDALGILYSEAVKNLNLIKKTEIYQTVSELWISTRSAKRINSFYPRSPIRSKIVCL